MQKQAVFTAIAFAIFLAVWLLPGVAHAQDPACVAIAGGVGYPSIGAAVAALGQGPGLITVTGTCTENVSINDAHSITIQAPVRGGAAVPGGATVVGLQDNDTFDIFRSQFIKLVNLEIVGVPGSTPASGGTGVFITQASNVQINGCDIHDNQGDGVSANNGSLLFLNNTTIHSNTPGNGLTVSSGSIANVRETTIENNGGPGALNTSPLATGGGGVFVGGNSTVRFTQNNLIQNNAEIGIFATNLSTVTFAQAGSTTVQGHTINGIFVNQGAHLQVNGPTLVQGNGGTCTSQTPCSGIFGTRNATMTLFGGSVNGNQGAGIFAEQGTNVRLNGATISNNSGDGVHIQWSSTADFRDFGAGSNNITGNGGASVFCDSRSLAIGNLTGLSNVQCGQNGQ
jgi:hypothetical protein